MCGTRDSSSLSGSITIEDDDEALLDSSIGSVFFPLRACNNKRKKSDDDGGFRGQKSSKDNDRDEKDGFGGVNIKDKAAVSSDEKISKTESTTLKVMSYNVWFREDLELHMRMKALGNLIRLHSPDIICFQEVTPNIYNIFQKSSWWNGYYCSVTNDMADTRAYFCMQLSKVQVKSFSCKPFYNSIMGRELCITDLEVQKNLALVIATSHLESPCPGPPKWDQMYSKERVEQAKNAINILKERQNVIFCGDMNWDDKLDGQFPLPDGWVDAWVKLRPKENGLTYDTKSNPMLSGNRALQKRLDRFLCNLLDFEIKKIEMIGTEAIPGLSYIKEKKVRGEVRKLELPVLPSDHFGLLLTLDSR